MYESSWVLRPTKEEQGQISRHIVTMGECFLQLEISDCHANSLTVLGEAGKS